MFGIVFLIILLEQWVDKYQDEFIGKLPYQINRLNGKSYSHKNNINHREKYYLEEIRKNVKDKYNDPMFRAMPYFYYKSLYEFFSDRPFLTIVYSENDDDFIHIEFRGLYPTKDLKETFSNFTEAVIAMYNDVLNQTQEYLGPLLSQPVPSKPLPSSVPSPVPSKPSRS
jgi:hypothetical protein